jgi:dihydrodipicolinate synthase/N-acetylneuraminate lyase
VTPNAPYAGVFPILPTAFDEQGDLDLASQRRAVDFFIAAGVHGFCILANYAEQWALTDAERDLLTDVILEHTAGRVPVIVTTSHYSARIAAERSRRAQAAGAAMAMLMPPYHGVLHPDDAGVFAFFEAVAAAVTIPIMVQDSPVSGVPLSAALLARLALEVPPVTYFKIESAAAALKIRELLRLARPHIGGAFDGEEGITLLYDLDAGATGTMPGGMIPDLFRKAFDLHMVGRRADAAAVYERCLPLLTYENKLCGLRATKVLFKEGGILRSEATRPPVSPLPPELSAGLLELAHRLDPLALRFGR